jgi:hypothetical protein
MKINGIDEIIKTGHAEKSAQKKADETDDFKKILKASVEQTADQPLKVRHSPSINPLSGVRLQPLSLETKHATVERVDNLLNLLDSYRKQLADPTMTLRKIEPVIHTIIKEKEQLASVLDSVSGDDGLKDIVNRTLITASLEVIKYNRGDYITS